MMYPTPPSLLMSIIKQAWQTSTIPNKNSLHFGEQNIYSLQQQTTRCIDAAAAAGNYLHQTFPEAGVGYGKVPRNWCRFWESFPK